MVSAGTGSLPSETPLGLSALMAAMVGFSCPRTQTSSANSGETASRPTTDASQRRVDMGYFPTGLNHFVDNLRRAVFVVLVGWVERSEAHRSLPAVGLAPLDPPYRPRSLT